MPTVLKIGLTLAMDVSIRVVDDAHPCIPAPLDAWTGTAPTFAIGTRALAKANHGKSCGTIVRSSGATSAISFGAAGELDAPAITAFLTGGGSNGNGSWAALTDQIGSATVAQATGSAQPGVRVNGLGVPVIAFGPNSYTNAVTDGTKSLGVSGGPAISISGNTVVYLVNTSRAVFVGSSNLANGWLAFSGGNMIGTLDHARSASSVPGVYGWFNPNFPILTPAAISNMAPSVAAMRFDTAATGVFCDGAVARFGAAASLSANLTTIGLALDNPAYDTQGADIVAMIVAQGHSEADVVANCAALRAWMSLDAPTTMFCTVGDSITAGYQTSTSVDNWELSWPYAMLDSIGRSSVKQVRAVNRAQAATTIADIQASRVTCVKSLLTASPAAWDFTNKVIVVLSGSNDIEFGRTAAQVIADLAQLVTDLHSDGWVKVIVGALIPREWPTGAGAKDAVKATVNASILANSIGADAIIDFTSINWVPSGTDWTTNYQDGTHPNATGVALMATLAKATIAPLL